MFVYCVLLLMCITCACVCVCVCVCSHIRLQILRSCTNLSSERECMRTVITTAPRNVALTATTLLAGRDFLQYIHGKGTKEQHVVILYGTLYLLAISKDHQSHFQKLYRSSRQPKNSDLHSLVLQATLMTAWWSLRERWYFY